MEASWGLPDRRSARGFPTAGLAASPTAPIRAPNVSEGLLSALFTSSPLGLGGSGVDSGAAAPAPLVGGFPATGAETGGGATAVTAVLGAGFCIIKIADANAASIRTRPPTAAWIQLSLPIRARTVDTTRATPPDPARAIGGVPFTVARWVVSSVCATAALAGSATPSDRKSVV